MVFKKNMKNIFTCLIIISLLLLSCTNKELVKEKVKVNVISMPCMELFDANSANYKNTIINLTKSIFIEAGSRQSWDKWMKSEDIFIGLETFGVSGPGKEVFDYFDINVSKVLGEARRILKIFIEEIDH